MNTIILHSMRNDELKKYSTNYKRPFCRNISIIDIRMSRLQFETYYTVYNLYVLLRLIRNTYI